MTESTLFTTASASPGSGGRAGESRPDGSAAADSGGGSCVGTGRVSGGGSAPGGSRGGSVSGSDAADVLGSGSADGGAAGFPAGDELTGRVLSSLDVLVAALGALNGARVEERLILVGRCESRLAAVKVEAVSELSRWRGEARAADVLHNDLKQSKGAAKGEVRLAGRLGEMSATAEALAAGAITPQHARLIAEAAEQAPAGKPIDEAGLLAAAEREPADRFGRTVRDQLNERAGDDLRERRKRQRDQRQLTWKHEPDGMYKLFGTFDPVTGARIETALTATANKLWRAEDAKNRPTSKQRLADALELLVTRGAAGKKAGATQGVDLLVIADYDAVAGRLTNGRLGDGTPLSPEELLRLACDANVLPAIFDQKGQPLWLGRGKRHATAGQRAALAARDKGCIGCGASANWCQAHHIVHWEHGGPTDIDNLCLLCSHCHHHEVHTNGAEIVRSPDGGYTLEHPARRRPNAPNHPRPPPPDGNR